MLESEAATTPIAIESSDVLQLKRREFKKQHSTIQTRLQHAVCVRRAYKQYGSKNNPNIILDGLNMTVPKGVIYGLLGASGCGKTTLLSCVVGRKRLNSGEIWVLGGKPGSRESGVPGPRLGFMPQEMALYEEFSIRETLIYFGWVAGMTTEQVDKKLDFLIKFLMLPAAGRLVKNLSGGQRRRVSLAAALVSDPELLILDEPTAGVDPILRQNIWDYLVQITKSGNTTVIMTTHYIDETRQAHLIGLMRGGHFLAEESPAHLLQRFSADSLEDVFLKLSVIQNRGRRRRSSILQNVTDKIVVPTQAVNDNVTALDENISEISGEFGENVSISSRIQPAEIKLPELPKKITVPNSNNLKIFQINHMKALLWKHFLWMFRNLYFLLISILGLPTSQIILFAFTIGHFPKDLDIAITNFELDSINQTCPLAAGCNTSMLSCRYLQHLEQRNVKLKNFETIEEAHETVREGKAWGALEFKHNYSESLMYRVNEGRNANPEIIDFSEVHVWLDMSNQQIGTLLQRDLYNSFFDFMEDITKSCNYSEKLGKLPLRFNDPAPIYGDDQSDFTDFAAPGVILTIVFFSAVALTCLAMLSERNEGILERSLICGVTEVEVLFAHVISQFLVNLLQTLLVLICAFALFNLKIEGAVLWVLSLTILTGFCGMCFGFLVSCCVDTEISATIIGLGSFIPIIILSGIMWPIEGMNVYLRYVSYFLPLTLSTQSLRSILHRGWSIVSPTVYFGFISTIVWIFTFLTLCIVILKYKK